MTKLPYEPPRVRRLIPIDDLREEHDQELRLALDLQAEGMMGAMETSAAVFSASLTELHERNQQLQQENHRLRAQLLAHGIVPESGVIGEGGRR